MSFIDLTKNVDAGREATTRSTVANTIAMAEVVISNLVGKELAASANIDLSSHLATVIGIELQSCINDNAVKESEDA